MYTLSTKYQINYTFTNTVTISQNHYKYTNKKSAIIQYTITDPTAQCECRACAICNYES